MFLILLQYMLLATTFTLGRAAMDYAQPVFFVGVRMIIGGVLLLLYQYFFDRDRWRLDRQDRMLFLKMMFFHVAISFGCEFWALQYISPAKTGLLWNFSPFVTALLAYLCYNQVMTGKQWLGLTVGFVGLLPSLIPFSSEATLSDFSYAEVVLCIAIFSGSYAWIIMKELVVGKNYTPIMVNGIAMLGGGLIDLFASFFVEKPPYITLLPRFGAHCSTSLAQLFCQWFSGPYAGLVLAFIYMILLIIIANIICFNLYGYLLRVYSPTFISFCGFTTPLFAALFDWLFRGEVVDSSFFISVAVVSVGLYLFYQDELKSMIR